MSKLINTDSDYSLWINQLVERYHSCQIRATVKAYEELLRFYWSTGEDIIKKKAESRWGEGVINSISQDLTAALPGVKGLSPTNLGYAKRFYSLYSQLDTFYPQLVGKTEYEQLKSIIFRIPWGHQRYLIDKFYNNPKRAFYYVRLTLEKGWSRAVLLNAIDLDLNEPEGKAVTNFSLTLLKKERISLIPSPWISLQIMDGIPEPWSIYATIPAFTCDFGWNPNSSIC